MPSDHTSTFPSYWPSSMARITSGAILHQGHNKAFQPFPAFCSFDRGPIEGTTSGFTVPPDVFATSTDVNNVRVRLPHWREQWIHASNWWIMEYGAIVWNMQVVLKGLLDLRLNSVIKKTPNTIFRWSWLKIKLYSAPQMHLNVTFIWFWEHHFWEVGQAK